MQAQDRIANCLAGLLVVFMVSLTAGGLVWSSDRPTTTLWTNEDAGRRTECVTRPVMDGIEVQLISNGAPVYSRVFNDGEEALQFAEDARRHHR